MRLRRALPMLARPSRAHSFFSSASSLTCEVGSSPSPDRVRRKLIRMEVEGEGIRQ